MWVKDLNGDLVNLTLAHIVGNLKGERGTVIAYIRSNAADGEPYNIPLFRGTREECGQYRDQLLDRLNRPNEPEVY